MNMKPEISWDQIMEPARAERDTTIRELEIREAQVVRMIGDVKYHVLKPQLIRDLTVIVSNKECAEARYREALHRATFAAADLLLWQKDNEGLVLPNGALIFR